MNQKKRKHLIVIAGPTAVGKTSLSVKLAREFNCEIISADSRQVFKELSIGTAKPDFKEQNGIKHHFLDFISINDEYNAGTYEREVITFLDDYFSLNDIAIICGGTGLYIDAVCNGMDEFTKISPELRAHIDEKYNQLGLKWLQDELKNADPDYFKMVDIHNPARLKRALEICISSGKKYSEQRTATTKKRNFTPVKILLTDDRTQLYNRINERVEKMFSAGLVDEAKSVYALRTLNALNTVGYKELFLYFDGKLTLEEAKEEIKKNSRRYAKRQLTWFSKNDDYTQFLPDQFTEIADFITKTLQK